MAIHATAEAPQKQKPSIPSTMRAAALDRFGGPEVLTIHEVPVPTLDANEILIAVHTAGGGPWDADMRGGWWPEGEPTFPLVLGSDGSGTVVDAGRSVGRLAIGDRVYSYGFANAKGGFYAEYVAVAAENAAHIPCTLSTKEAGGAATVGLTALQGIDNALGMKRDEIVIIHGATGGVGSLAVQFAKLRGARVISTARGEAGLQFARRTRGRRCGGRPGWRHRRGCTPIFKQGRRCRSGDRRLRSRAGDRHRTERRPRRISQRRRTGAEGAPRNRDHLL